MERTEKAKLLQERLYWHLDNLVAKDDGSEGTRDLIEVVHELINLASDMTNPSL